MINKQYLHNRAGSGVQSIYMTPSIHRYMFTPRCDKPKIKRKQDLNHSDDDLTLKYQDTKLFTSRILQERS